MAAVHPAPIARQISTTNIGDNLPTMTRRVGSEPGPGESRARGTAASWRAVAALVDRSRRALYDYVRHQDHPITRDEAAGVLAMSHNLVAFHLDKLVEVGLLRARYEAAPLGRPRGRGRAPKVYESAETGVAVSIPERRYDLAGEILADALAEGSDEARSAAMRCARERGEELGRMASSGQHQPGHLHRAAALLADLGFEPSLAGERIVVRNCPFHALARHQPQLICGLNVAFVEGLLAGIRAPATAHLAPRPGMCCVEVRLRDAAETGAAGAPPCRDDGIG